jgi:hypothetical protein
MACLVFFFLFLLLVLHHVLLCFYYCYYSSSASSVLPSYWFPQYVRYPVFSDARHSRGLILLLAARRRSCHLCKAGVSDSPCQPVLHDMRARYILGFYAPLYVMLTAAQTAL